MSQLSFVDFTPEPVKYQSVSELTRKVKICLEDEFNEVFILGEISNFKHHSSGHMYFSLKDDYAQISCVLWRSRNERLFFTPQNGMKVTVFARMAVYEKRGNYQLDVFDMQPAGIGELQQAFENLKIRLRDEGLFDVEHKKAIPPFPQRIGLVTSPTGAAIQDLMNVLQRRNPAVELILSPVRVQGEGAAFEIAQAIDDFNEYKNVDLLIVGRGGGSLEDLWPFNEEMVARAVYRSEIPIISAVGHEIDFTICDFVADLRAPTPSAAAELAVPVRSDLKTMLTNVSEGMSRLLLERISSQREKISTIQSSYAFRHPADMVQQNMQRLDEFRKRLDMSVLHKVVMTREAVNGMVKRLSLLEHKNVLKRGYSLCYRDGELVNSAKQLAPDDQIHVTFYQGHVFGKVTEIHDENI